MFIAESVAYGGVAAVRWIDLHCFIIQNANNCSVRTGSKVQGLSAVSEQTVDGPVIFEQVNAINVHSPSRQSQPAGRIDNDILCVAFKKIRTGVVPCNDGCYRR
jgi:hypothetical protein